MFNDFKIGRSPHFRCPVLLLRLIVLIMIVTSCVGPLSPGYDSPAKIEDGIYSTDFGSYRGTAETLPQGMFVTGENSQGSEIGRAFDPFTGVHSTSPYTRDSFDGFGAFYSGGNYAFGIREDGESDLQNARLFLTYTNRTGRTITGFRVTYTVQVWFLGQRDNRIRLKYHTDTSGYSDIDDIVSTLNPRYEITSDDGLRLVGSQPKNQTEVDYTFALHDVQAEELADGETAYFRWQYSNGIHSDGPLRSGLAIDDIRIEPQFEGDW